MLRPDSDPHLDANGRAVAGSEADADAGAGGAAWRNRHTDVVGKYGLAAPITEMAPFRPRFAAAAAGEACHVDGHGERHDEAAERFALRQQHVGPEQIDAVTLAEKRVAHAFDDAPHGGEVDSDLVGKTFVRHQVS